MMEFVSCPNVTALCEFLDGELEDDEKAGIERHLMICSDCANRTKELMTTGPLFMKSLEQSAKFDEHSRFADCIYDDILCFYLHDALPADQKIALEAHLDNCDRCLSELSAMARVGRLLSYGSVEPVPDYLRERVESLAKEKETAADQVVKIVCRLAQDGIEFLRESLIPQGMTLQEVFATSNVYRSTEARSMPASILVKGELAGASLGLSVNWENGKRAGLNLQLQDEQSRPMPSQRVLLRRDQALIHSERTDADGRVAIPNLDPGVYQIGMIIFGEELNVELEIKET